MKFSEKIGLKILNSFDPETAHNVALKALKFGLSPRIKPYQSDKLHISLAGLKLENPVGLAAGFDKNAESCGRLSKLGFGFLEIGAVTPFAQKGNAKPRLFRLYEDNAIINRFGFNNNGSEAVKKELMGYNSSTPIGINLGANKDSSDRIEDYSKVLLTCGDLVDFATLNISSPNTEKLRELQKPAELMKLVSQIEQSRSKLKKYIPIFIKISPDLKDGELEPLIKAILQSGIDGLIATNTTLNRKDLKSSFSKESGGLSGEPLKNKSTRIIAKISNFSDGRLPIIGVGGISSARDAYDKICAGASALQIYTAIIYKGFSVINEISEGLDKLLISDGHNKLCHAVGSKRSEWL